MYDVTKANDISILHLYGEISLMEMELLEKVITSFKKHKHYKILLDLAGVDHVHFEVTRQLVEKARDLQTRNGDLKLANLNEPTRDVFRFTGADQHIEDYANLSDAILSFLRSGGHEILGSAKNNVKKPGDLTDAERMV